MMISPEAVASALDGRGFCPVQIDRFASHLNLLLKWNKAYNLTAITDQDQVITQHLLDSLSIKSAIEGKSIYDIGTGGGFPGIPMAITFPEKRFILVDTVQKKTRFLRQVVAQLGLKNVEVKHARVETLKPEKKADQIVSRAFSSIPDFLNLTLNLADDHTEWLAMKGKSPTEELETLSPELTYTVDPLNVPGLNAERHLVRIQKAL